MPKYKASTERLSLFRELEDIDNYIVPAGLGGKQGIMGALKLAFDSPV